MGDEGLDPCACVWSEQFSMLRLLSILRQSQAYCSDTECLTDALPGPNGAVNETNFTMLILMTIFAVLMYALRPSALRENGIIKGRDDNDPNDNPRQPPPMAN